MADYGIKVMKEGYDISDTDIRNILMSSKYPMLKYHSDNTGSVSFNPGESDKYIEFTHGLGYTPAFIAFYEYGGRIYNVNAIQAVGAGTAGAYAWSNSTVVRVGFAFTGRAYGEKRFTISSNDDVYDAYWGLVGWFLLGKESGNARNGAVRFRNVGIAKNEPISSATLTIEFEFNSGANKDLKSIVRGIDEDNTADFTGGAPMDRSSTDANTTNSTNLSSNTKVNVNVTGQVQEITTRAGWASGNSMGFQLRDNGSDDGVYIEDDYGTGATTNLTVFSGSALTVNFRVIIFKDRLT